MDLSAETKVRIATIGYPKFLLLDRQISLSVVSKSNLRHVVGGVSPSSLGIYPGHLSFVVVHEVYGLGLEVVHACGLRE